MSVDATARRVTAADVARAVGVSRATVGFVLNDTPGQTISAATRERVLAEATRLGYRPHLAARALASGQSRIVLMVLPDWPIEYSISTHLDVSSHALDEAGFSLVTWTPHPKGRARPLWESLQPDVVLGLTPFPEKQLEQIRATGAVVVTPEADADSEARSAGFSVGPELQVQHLVDQGHSSLAFASSPDARVRILNANRLRRARKAATRLGVPLVDARVTDANVGDSVDAWTRAGVTGIVAYNDDIAALVVGAGLRRGLRVPQDIAVIGHDDAPISQLMVPSLSTIRVDAHGLGQYLADLALAAANRGELPAPVSGQATVVARESTGG